jgi:hypothetical protein
MTLLGPAQHVGVEDHGEVVYIAPLPDGPIRVLEGVAALIWRAACAGPSHTIAPRVLFDVADPPADASDMIESVVSELRMAGLLVVESDR